MAEIYLLRHGQSTWNAERRWAGHEDPPLNDVGRQQAIYASSQLGKEGFTHATSSSLQRARETASIISKKLCIELVEPIPELNERHCGKLTGLTSQEIEIHFPGLLEEWGEGNIIEIPCGEAWNDFVSRVHRGLNKLSSLSGRILVVAHEGVLRTIEYKLGERLRKHENLGGRWVEV